MASSPTFVAAGRIGVVQIVNADGTNKKTVVTGGNQHSKIVSLTATSTDTSAHNLTVSITRSAVNYDLCTYTVPASAGEDAATSAVNLLASLLLPGLPIDNDGNRYLFIENGDTLTVSSNTAVTSGKVINLLAVYGDF